MREFEEMKLARVIDACGGIDGRVKMQKIAYLLKAMGYDLPFDDFRIRQHGPFSRGVACATDLLSGAGFVVEDAQPLSITNQLGEPAHQYSYQLNDSVRDLVHEHFDVLAPEGKPPIEGVASELRSQDRKVLEVAATKIYLQSEDGLSGDELDAELVRLKGHLSDSFAEADALLADCEERGWLSVLS